MLQQCEDLKENVVENMAKQLDALWCI